jgi:hypothetical protein
LTETNWRKSSYSGGSGGQCVEIASADGQVSVRDTKDNERGPVLRVSADEWARFARTLKK